MVAQAAAVDMSARERQQVAQEQLTKAMLVEVMVVLTHPNIQAAEAAAQVLLEEMQLAEALRELAEQELLHLLQAHQ